MHLNRYISVPLSVINAPLSRIESPGCVVRFLPVRKRPVVELRLKAIKICMHSRSEAKSGRLGQAAESQRKDGARVAISYKFPADDSFSFAVWQSAREERYATHAQTRVEGPKLECDLWYEILQARLQSQLSRHCGHR